MKQAYWLGRPREGGLKISSFPFRMSNDGRSSDVTVTYSAGAECEWAKRLLVLAQAYGKPHNPERITDCSEFVEYWHLYDVPEQLLDVLGVPESMRWSAAVPA